MKTKIYPHNISRQIDTNFRNYALYVLENRGIPSFYDALTNVQRFIILNAPHSFNKTISLVGACIADGYHHGDCLQGDTMIRLADGHQISIQEWCEKYPDAKLELFCYDETKKEITTAFGHSPRIGQKTSTVIEIELENGEMFRMTKNHPLLTKRGWIKAEDLLESDEILQKP